MYRHTDSRNETGVKKLLTFPSDVLDNYNENAQFGCNYDLFNSRKV